MNRVDKKFYELKNNKKPAFIPFITAGDPDLQTTKALILEFEKGVPILLNLASPFLILLQMAQLFKPLIIGHWLEVSRLRIY